MRPFWPRLPVEDVLRMVLTFSAVIRSVVTLPDMRIQYTRPQTILSTLLAAGVGVSAQASIPPYGRIPAGIRRWHRACGGRIDRSGEQKAAA